MNVGLPLAIGWGAALLLLALDGRRRWVGLLGVLLGLGLLGSLAALAVTVSERGPVSTVTGGWPREVGIHLRADGLGVLFAVVSIALLVAVLAFEAARGIEARIFPGIVLCLATGLTGLFLTADVFNFYVFFELSMAAAFVLVNYGSGRAQSRAAAVFVVLNLVGSVFFLSAVAILYRLTGTLEMLAVARRIQEAAPGVVLLIGTLVLVTLGLKLGLFPFHYWLPVVYRDTRPAVAALFAGVLANVASYGLLRFGAEILPGALASGRWLLLTLGAASVLYGSLQALHRPTLADMLAYSSIGQAGYTVLALAVGGPVGLAAGVLYSLINSLHKTALFLGIGVAGPGIAFPMLAAGLSMAGLPPSAGFVGKMALIRAGVAADDALMLGVVVLGSAASFLYFLRAWQDAYWLEDRRPRTVSPFPSRAMVGMLAAAALVLGLWPAPLVEWAQRAAGALGAAP